MSFARPSLADLIDRASADIEAGLPGTDARLRRSNLAVLARVHAATVYGLYGYLDWISKQITVETCEAELLDRRASVWGVYRKPADYARGTVQFSGTNGVVVPAGTPLTRGDGALFFTTEDSTIAAGVVNVAVIADEAGAAGNSAAGSSLTFQQPLGNVSPTGTVLAPGLSGGIDIEADEALRPRLLARIQAPPMGGSASDYVAWALQVPGVTRAWVYPLEDGVGTVRVRFVRDNDASFIPDVAEVAAVQAYIDQVRPVCANVTVSAPIAVALNLTIQLTPDTSQVRAAVTAELADLFVRESYPGATILVSHLREAISVAAGETNHVLVSPTADVAYSASQIAKLGTITWA